MSQILQNVVKFQKNQLENLVDFEKCCKTHIFLQKSVPIQPKTSNTLPKFCQKLATTLRVHRRCSGRASRPVSRGGRGSPAAVLTSRCTRADQTGEAAVSFLRMSVFLFRIASVFLRLSSLFAAWIQLPFSNSDGRSCLLFDFRGYF